MRTCVAAVEPVTAVEPPASPVATGSRDQGSPAQLDPPLCAQVSNMPSSAKHEVWVYDRVNAARKKIH